MLRVHAQRLKRLEFRGIATLDFDTIGFIVLSSILATVALLTNSVPVLIGAMILAPAFDPLIAIPFGILSSKWNLVKQGIISSVVLFGVSFVISLLVAYAFMRFRAISVEVEHMEREMLMERLRLGWYSVVTALAAGGGGALATAANRKSNLVGVVIALALVPALAASAIAFCSGSLSGWQGLKLFAVNVAGILVAGVVILSLRVMTGRMEERIAEEGEEL